MSSRVFMTGRTVFNGNLPFSVTSSTVAPVMVSRFGVSVGRGSTRSSYRCMRVGKLANDDDVISSKRKNNKIF